MGKLQRHKKEIRAEKSKTKLKQSKTKFLPKGQNITDTTFKIKSIVLPEQLKIKNSADLLSKRKLNVKDLLSRIKHYNLTIRSSACEELTELTKIYTQEIIQQYLAPICLAVSTLMQDRETKVRKSAVKSIETILKLVPDENLIPFYNYFSTNLRCAMTNIDKHIQEDSLLFLDCFINSNSNILIKSSDKFLPDFLSLISKLRSNSELGRTLTLNLGSKMTIVTWRIKVLIRLHAVLKEILNNSSKANYKKKNDIHMHFIAQNSTEFPIYQNTFSNNLETPVLDIFTTTPPISSNNNNNNNNNNDVINRHIITLVPLLYETWLEVVPEQKVHKTSTENFQLTEEEGSLLTCITNTLYLLWKYVKSIQSDEINLNTVFFSSEGRKFLNHLITNFPYCHNGTRSKKPKNKSLKLLAHNNDSRCVHENLLICFLYLTLHVNCTQHNLKKDIIAINAYLTKIFLQRINTLKSENIQCILELLNECLGEKYLKWMKRGVDLKIILENAILLYDNGKFEGDKNKLELFKVLAGIIDNTHLSTNEKYQSWLKNLPLILNEPMINGSIVAALLELSKKDSKSFHTSFAQNIPNILANLETIEISSAQQEKETALRNLAAIFYYIPIMSEENLEEINNFVCNTTQMSNHTLRKYLQHTMDLREEFGKNLKRKLLYFN